MKKITEIYIEKEYMKSERDIYGNRVKVPTIGRFKREINLVNPWARLGHYLIDFAIMFGIAFVLATILLMIAPKVILFIANPIFEFKLGFFDIEYDVFSMIIIVLYYFITELTMQRSIGKFVTGTVVIDEYGNKPANGVLVGRSFSRLIPFETLSCLQGRGWHDRFSGTFVVKKSEAEELRRLLQNPNSFQLSDSDEILD